MKTILTLLYWVISTVSFAQRWDGFFIQELSFIDVDLLKQNAVDKIDITVFQNGRPSVRRQIFLDSAYRKIKETITYGTSTTHTDYSSTVISQLACPATKPSYIKTCEKDIIVNTENDGAYSSNAFDSLGRPIRMIWKPGPQLLEINRTVLYSPAGLVDSIKIQDFRPDRSIDKTELLVYEYNGEKLTAIRQLLQSGARYEPAGKFSFNHYRSGLVKSSKGDAYFGAARMKVDFKYYKNGG
ncbi:MAG: hypothetical protein EOP49_46260, partial [Sphingobacteriales bacterium]